MNGWIVGRPGRARGSTGERTSIKTPVLGLSFLIGVRALVERMGVSAMASGTRPAGLGGTVVMIRSNGVAFRHGHGAALVLSSYDHLLSGLFTSSHPIAHTTRITVYSS